MIWLIIIIYFFREILEDSKLLYFHYSKLSLMMATIISQNTSEKQ